MSEGAETPHQGAGPTAGWSGPPPADAGLWRAPQSVWLLALLAFLTFGFYLFFWTGRFAGDLKRNLDPKVRPWLHVVALAIPIGALILLFVQHGRLRELLQTAGLKPRVGPEPFVLWFIALVLVVPIAAGYLSEGEGNLTEWLAMLLSLACALSPWPLMQFELNRFKAQLEGARWIGRPFRLTAWQGVALALGLLCHGLIFLGTFVYYMPDGRVFFAVPLSEGEIVESSSGLYRVTVPSGNWVSLPDEDLAPDSDLELLGTWGDSDAVVYLHDRADMSFEEVADARLDLIYQFLEVHVDRTEARQLAAGGRCLYRHVEAMDYALEERVVYEIGLCEAGDVLIEIIAMAWRSSEMKGEILPLVDSLEPVGPND